MRRTETPPDGDPNRALTSLPDDLADGHYRAVVLEVIAAVTHGRTRRTVHVRVEPASPRRDSYTTLLPASALGARSAVRPGTVHEMVVDYVETAPRHLDATPSFDDLSKSQKNNAYRRLDRHLDPLVERGFVILSAITT